MPEGESCNKKGILNTCNNMNGAASKQPTGGFFEHHDVGDRIAP